MTLRNRFLVDVEDQVWLSLLGHYPMTVDERRALVFAHREGSVTPGRLRQVLGDSDVTVTAVLHADAPAVGAFARCWAIQM